MNKVRFVEAKYDTVLSWDLDSIAETNNFNVEDIIKVDVGKWTSLEVHLKDGRVFYQDGNSDTDSTDWKWAVQEKFYSKDFIELDKEEVFDE